nr:HNH endonuclease signature motif containing protein [Kurthia massiliensis]
MIFLNSPQWKRKRKVILKRDKYICQRCLYKFNLINYQNLQVHHIKSRKDYPELRLNDENLITVCKTCNLELGTSNKLDFERM